MRFTPLIFSLIVMIACSEKDETIPSPNNYFHLSNQPHFDSSMNEKTVALGRKLFYDPVLSKSNTISCASCHDQKKAFTDGVAQSSIGESKNQLKRNSPTLTNIGNVPELFWDGGAHDLASQALGPLTSIDEMGQSLAELQVELRSLPEYRLLFKEAFGVDSIKIGFVQRALAHFQSTLISNQSNYDKGQLNDDEKLGEMIFQENCSACHEGLDFTDFKYHNNGLDESFPFEGEDERLGRARITKSDQDLGRYRTPTLRNIGFTSPYMHDGRFESLKQVIEHYSTGIKKSITLSTDIPENGFQLTALEKSQLEQFLKTLSDSSFIINPQFSKP